jgi:phosphatidate cytidylyltransferase
MGLSGRTARFFLTSQLTPLIALIAALLSAHELFAMVAPAHPLLRAHGVAATLVIFVLIAAQPLAQFFPLGAIAVVCVGMLCALASPEPVRGAASRIGWAVAGPFYVGALFATIAAIYQHAHGGSWVLLVLLCSFMSDTAAYFSGKYLGRHKMSPVISPNKTWEGSVGGLLAGLLSGFLMQHFLLPTFPLAHVAPLTLLATAAGQAGDLCESLIKRSVDVKDSGTILPGHGGMLDRSDAMLFSSAVVWAYLTLAAV